MYFKKKYSATLLVLGVACALKFLVDKMALGQWVLIELRFPFCQYSSNRCSVSFTCPADRQWASLYVAILQQTVWAHPEKKEVNPLWIYLIKPTDALISQIYFCQETLHVSGQFLCSIIRNFPLYIRHWYMSYRFDDSFQAWPGWSYFKAVIKPVWHIPVTNVQWKTPDDGQRNCPETCRVSWQK